MLWKLLEYKIRIDKEYPITFNELEFDEKEKSIFISICGYIYSLNNTIHKWIFGTSYWTNK